MMSTPKPKRGPGAAAVDWGAGPRGLERFEKRVALLCDGGDLLSETRFLLSRTLIPAFLMAAPSEIQ